MAMLRKKIFTKAHMKSIGKVADYIDKATLSPKSIAGMAKENIFEFPVFVSSSVGLNYATATNSLVEQIYASYLQMAISINPVVDADTIARGAQFANFKTDTNKYLEFAYMDYAHDACHNVIQEGNTITEFDMLTLPNEVIEFVTEYCNHEPLSEFGHFFQEVKIDTDDPDSPEYRKFEAELLKKYNEETKNDKDESLAELNEKRSKIADKDIKSYKGKIQREKNKDEREKNKDEREAKKSDRDDVKHKYDIKTPAPKMLDEGKIQKLNTMKPLMMNVSFKVKADNGAISDPVDYIIGVKTYCRIVDADILPEVAHFPIKEMDKLSRRAKWRAGEIKFFEFLFKTKEKKQTAIDSKDPKRKWYRRLYELAHSTNDSVSAFVKAGDYRHNKGKFKSINGVMPNATIIMTQSDVDNIKSQVNIDLLKTTTAKSFCKELFLMSFVVIDVDNESIKILTPDLHNDFEVHSIASVTKQLSTLDTSGVTASEISKMFGGRK